MTMEFYGLTGLPSGNKRKGSTLTEEFEGSDGSLQCFVQRCKKLSLHNFPVVKVTRLLSIFD